MYLQGFFRNESYTPRESSGMTHTFKQSNMSNSINCEFNWMNYKNQVRISVYIILSWKSILTPTDLQSYHVLVIAVAVRNTVMWAVTRTSFSLSMLYHTSVTDARGLGVS